MTDVGVVYHGIDAWTPTEFARRAADRGYDSVWVSEGWGESTVVLLTEMAGATDDVLLGSAILNVFSRTPATLAMTNRSLQRASDGRFLLGLGTSHPPLVEDLHGLSFERPVQRARETVELLDELVGGDGTVSYDGELFRVEGYDPLSSDLRVYNAAMGPANRRLTGALCAGWVPNQIPLTALDQAFEAVADGARAVGRDPKDVTVSPWVPAAVAADGERARDVIRRTIATYVGRFESYESVVAESHPDEARAIADAWRESGKDEAAAAVNDVLVDAMGVAGTSAEGRARFDDVLEDPLLDRVVVSVPGWAPEPVIEQTVDALARA